MYRVPPDRAWWPAVGAPLEQGPRENVWDPERGRSQTHVVHNCGRADNPAVTERLRKLAASILRRCSAEDIEASSGGDLRLVCAWPYGDVYVLQALWQRLGIDQVIRSQAHSRRLGFDVERALFAMVANRACAPCSKLYCWEHWLKEEVHIAGTQGLSLQHLYRAMDFLEANKEPIERARRRDRGRTGRDGRRGPGCAKQARGRAAQFQPLRQVPRAGRQGARAGLQAVDACRAGLGSDMKSTLDMRPVFHWAPHRIHAHVAITVLSLLLERTVEHACADTWRNVSDRLRRIQLAQLSSPHGTVWQVTDPTPEAAKCLKTLQIKPPPPVLQLA